MIFACAAQPRLNHWNRQKPRHQSFNQDGEGGFLYLDRARYFLYALFVMFTSFCFMLTCSKPFSLTCRCLCTFLVIDLSKRVIF
jgi:hypothetical protein